MGNAVLLEIKSSLGHREQSGSLTMIQGIFLRYCLQVMMCIGYVPGGRWQLTFSAVSHTFIPDILSSLSIA